MRGSMVSVMPISQRSDVVSRSDSLNASAYAFDVLLWSNHSQVERLLGLLRLGAVGDVAVTIVGFEELRTDLELDVRLLQRCADLLNGRLARNIEQLLLVKRHLTVDDLVRYLAAVGRQLVAEEACKDDE
eukprot:6172851-Pleurochrysis_carterae.AAC.4